MAEGEKVNMTANVSKSYTALLDEYCSKNSLPSPVYTFEHKKMAGGIAKWIFRVTVGHGIYEGDACMKKQDAKQCCAGVAYTMCTKVKSTTGALSPQQKMQLYVDCQCDEAIRNIEALRAACYTALGVNPT